MLERVFIIVLLTLIYAVSFMNFVCYCSSVNLMVNVSSMYYSWTLHSFKLFRKLTIHKNDYSVNLGNSFPWGIFPQTVDIYSKNNLYFYPYRFRFLSLSLSPSLLSLLCLPVPPCFLPLTPFPLCPTFTGQMPKAVLLCPQLPSLTVLCKRLSMSEYVCVHECLCMCACVFA